MIYHNNWASDKPIVWAPKGWQRGREDETVNYFLFFTVDKHFLSILHGMKRVQRVRRKNSTWSKVPIPWNTRIFNPRLKHLYMVAQELLVKWRKARLGSRNSWSSVRNLCARASNLVPKGIHLINKKKIKIKKPSPLACLLCDQDIRTLQNNCKRDRKVILRYS